jgi:hypothetical protein
MLPRCLFLSLLLIALPWRVSAQPAPGIFEVPFEFVAFDTVFAPGKYVAEFPVPWHILLLNQGTRKAESVPFLPGTRTERTALNVLVFDKVGDLYILRGCRWGATGSAYKVPLAKKWRDRVQLLTSQGLQPEPLVIAPSW